MNSKKNIFLKKFFNIFTFICITYTLLFSSGICLASNFFRLIEVKKNISHISHTSSFKNDNEKISYALGVSLGSYMERSLIDQENLGFFLDKTKFILGLKDTIFGTLKLSNEEIANRLRSLEYKLRDAEIMMSKKRAEENYTQGKVYISNFVKKIGVKKTSTGLCILIKKLGDGQFSKDNDMILVNYKGTLIDGSEFDNSYTSGPIWLSIKDVIQGWQEGIKYISKGGKIQLVIPPQLAYGENGVPGIPGNSTLIFDIELIDIKSILK